MPRQPTTSIKLLGVERLLDAYIDASCAGRVSRPVSRGQVIRELIEEAIMARLSALTKEHREKVLKAKVVA